MFVFSALIYKKVIFSQKMSFLHLGGAVEIVKKKYSNFALIIGGGVKKSPNRTLKKTPFFWSSHRNVAQIFDFDMRDTSGHKTENPPTLYGVHIKG